MERPWKRRSGRLIEDDRRDDPVTEELFNGRILTTLQEAQALTELKRREYNQVRPHSAFDYKPPAPEATPGPLSATASYLWMWTH